MPELETIKSRCDAQQDCKVFLTSHHCFSPVQTAWKFVIYMHRPDMICLTTLCKQRVTNVIQILNRLDATLNLQTSCIKAADDSGWKPNSYTLNTLMTPKG